MLGLVSKIVKKVSLKHVVLWLITGILIILGYTVYEHRNELFKGAVSLGQKPSSVNIVGATFKLSESTKEKIRDYTALNENYVGFSVSSADIRLNSRVTVYFYTADNDGISETRRPIERLPLFSNDDEINRQMVKMINGEFSCSPYSTTILAKIRRDLNPKVQYVCRASLPPYYGHFSGFVTVYLKQELSIDQLPQLKSGLEAFATEIYFKDVIPSTRILK